MARKFKYDYAGELHRRGLSYATDGDLIRAVWLGLSQRDALVRGGDFHEQIDANRRAIVAEIDRQKILMSPKVPPTPMSVAKMIEN